MRRKKWHIAALLTNQHNYWFHPVYAQKWILLYGIRFNFSKKEKVFQLHFLCGLLQGQGRRRRPLYINSHVVAMQGIILPQKYSNYLSDYHRITGLSLGLFLSRHIWNLAGNWGNSKVRWYNEKCLQNAKNAPVAHNQCFFAPLIHLSLGRHSWYTTRFFLSQIRLQTQKSLPLSILCMSDVMSLTLLQRCSLQFVGGWWHSCASTTAAFHAHRIHAKLYVV